jgi:hypothetical protein
MTTTTITTTTETLKTRNYTKAAYYITNTIHSSRNSTGMQLSNLKEQLLVTNLTA